ncbi:MAG: hypothetical protein ACLP7P_00175 [Rhodomicrobium sp.]
MARRLKWRGDDKDERDACGSVTELIGTIGLFYIALICLGIAFVTLENLHSAGDSASQARPPQAALFQALLPFDSGH